MSSDRTILAKYVAASTKAHLTAAVVAVLEYAQYIDGERPSMWPYAEDLWTWVCGQSEVEQLALVARMIQHARNRLTPAAEPPPAPDGGDDT